MATSCQEPSFTPICPLGRHFGSQWSGRSPLSQGTVCQRQRAHVQLQMHVPPEASNPIKTGPAAEALRELGHMWVSSLGCGFFHVLSQELESCRENCVLGMAPFQSPNQKGTRKRSSKRAQEQKCVMVMQKGGGAQQAGTPGKVALPGRGQPQRRLPLDRRVPALWSLPLFRANWKNATSPGTSEGCE